MAISSAYLNKLIKLLVAAVVVASVSFGAYGFGRATESSVKNPKDAVFKIVSSWQNIDSYCPTSCSWDLMQRMVQVTLPAGNYMLSTGGLIVNSSSSLVNVDCQFVSESGDLYRAYGQLALDANRSGMMTLHSYARLTDDFTTLKLNCGTQSDVTPVQILDASISAIRVDSLRYTEKYRPS